MRHSCLIISAAIIAATSSPVNATGFLLSEQSTLANGRAYSGAGVVGDDLSAVFFNPAGMTLLPGTRAQAGFMVVGTGFKFTSDDHRVKENGRNKEAAVPSIYLTHQFNNDIWLAFGITTPYGLSTNYHRNWAYAQRGDYAKIFSFDFNPSVAWKISDQLSVGAGVSAQYAKARLGMRLAEDEQTAATGMHGYMNADGWQYGFNAGVMYAPSEKLRFGLAYRSSMSHKAKGDFTVKGLKGSSMVDTVDFVTDTTAKLKTPATAIFSSAWEFAPKWTASTIIRWSKWSNLKNISIANRTESVQQGLASGAPALTALIDKQVKQGLKANGVPETDWSTYKQPALLNTIAESKKLPLEAVQSQLGSRSYEELVDLVASEKGHEAVEHISNININANFQDTWLFGAGLDYDVNDVWTVRGGLCYETNPIKHQRDRLAVLPDSARVWFTLGTSYKPSKNLQIDASLCYLKALGKSELFDYQNGKRVGKYNSHSQFAGVQIQYLF